MRASNDSDSGRRQRNGKKPRRLFFLGGGWATHIIESGPRPVFACLPWFRSQPATSLAAPLRSVNCPMHGFVACFLSTSVQISFLSVHIVVSSRCNCYLSLAFPTTTTTTLATALPLYSNQT